MNNKITKFVKLKDVADIQLSNVDKKYKENEIQILLCNFIDIYYNWAITKNKMHTFMKATAKDTEIAKFILKKGQVALTKDSETKYDIGNSSYIADNFENVILGYHCALITPNIRKLCGKYLNALFHTSYAQKYFELNASGSGQRYTLSIGTIEDFPVYLLQMKEQKNIGNLLSKIDIKIELNKKINDNLAY